jgi:hypothetical protein
MDYNDHLDAPKPQIDREKLRKFGLKLQEIEGNPLSSEQIAMFDRLDRDGLTSDERLAVLTERARKIAAR